MKDYDVQFLRSIGIAPTEPPKLRYRENDEVVGEDVLRGRAAELAKWYLEQLGHQYGRSR